ncbi:hypothetical protein LCGC14_1823610 [marine sediment metagenome]|uniref:Uncharacterized protein n=1 Tax=marine sediment metagenome TaxID=412755 RepID=A0A0F9GI56_9ZZZZ
MLTTLFLKRDSTMQSLDIKSWGFGLLLSAIIAFFAIWTSQLNSIHQLGISALTIAIACGILVGNTVFPAISEHCAVGVDFSKNQLLRLGIILFGFNVSFQQISEVGWHGLAIAITIVSSTLFLGYQIGTRLFKLDRQTSILIGAGSAICGAAAIIATEPVIRAQAHKVTIAIATVVIFGTLSMLIYPLLYPYLGLTEHSYGVFAGSTIHEVAQVVAAGHSVSDVAESTAVVKKKLRVMLLAPFLLALSFIEQRRTTQLDSTKKRTITIPWFAFLFILASGINSLNIIPPMLTEKLIQLDTILLTMAMAALGLRTHIGAVRQAGIKPLLLAASLFSFLLVGGLYLNKGFNELFA